MSDDIIKTWTRASLSSCFSIEQSARNLFVLACIHKTWKNRRRRRTFEVRRSKQNQAGLRQPLPDQNSTTTPWFGFGTTSLLLFESPASAHICRWGQGGRHKERGRGQVQSASGHDGGGRARRRWRGQSKAAANSWRSSEGQGRAVVLCGRIGQGRGVWGRRRAKLLHYPSAHQIK